MALFTKSPRLSNKFAQALLWASDKHQLQIRKDQKETPYIAHLLAVASLVLECGGSENCAIAALAHDTCEDVGVNIKEIEVLFGSEVAAIVTTLSEDKSLPKQEQKQAYVNAIARADYETALVSAADKLHNLRCYLQSPELVTPDVISFYCQLYPHYEAILDPIHKRQFDNWIPKHPIVLEMCELIVPKLIPLYSAYWVRIDEELIFTHQGQCRYIDVVAFPTLRVATSTDLINNPWRVTKVPAKLRLADGEFDSEALLKKKAAVVDELEFIAPPEIKIVPRLPYW